MKGRNKPKVHQKCHVLSYSTSSLCCSFVWNCFMFLLHPARFDLKVTCLWNLFLFGQSGLGYPLHDIMDPGDYCSITCFLFLCTHHKFSTIKQAPVGLHRVCLQHRRGTWQDEYVEGQKNRYGSTVMVEPNFKSIYDTTLPLRHIIMTSYLPKIPF